MKFNRVKYPLLCGMPVSRLKFARSLFENTSLSEIELKIEISKMLTQIQLILNLASKGAVTPCFVSKKFEEAAYSNNEALYPQSKKLYNELYIYFCKGFVQLGIHGHVHYVVVKDVIVAIGIYSHDLGWVLFYNKNHKNLKQATSDLIAHPAAISLFRKYAEIKPKTLPPSKKVKEFNCKYKSDLDYSIELLTENWYTESLQAHPFAVRGHWRHQACGENLKERKLKWIDTYMKKGMKKGAYKNG